MGLLALAETIPLSYTVSVPSIQKENIMKRFFIMALYLFLLIATPLARAEAPWGALIEMNDPNRRSAIDYLISSKPIYYAISLETTDREKVAFLNSIHRWQKETLLFIQESNRTEEFKDIIPYLQRHLDLRPVLKPGEADIYLDISSKNDERASYIQPSSSKPYFRLYVTKYHRGKSLDPVILHEIGHFFGLGDQYTASRANSDANHSSDVNLRQGSVMNEAKDITCDDVDGFINLLDLRLSKRSQTGQFSDRAKKGWKTFCPGSFNFYQEAQTITRRQKDLIVEQLTPEISQAERIYQSGELVAVKRMIRSTALDNFLVLENGQGIKRDPKTGLIISVTIPIEQEITTSDRKSYSQMVNSVRTFTYGIPKETEDGEILVYVWVKETVDGVELKSFRQTLSSKTGLRSSASAEFAPNGHITIKKDWYGKKITLKFQRQEEDSFDTYSLSIPEGFAYHKAGEPLLTFRDAKNNLYGSKLPLVQSHPLYAYWNLIQEYKRDLESFYKNFYTPVFAKIREDKLKESIKDSLKK